MHKLERDVDRDHTTQRLRTLGTEVLDYERIFDHAPALLLLLANDSNFTILRASDAYMQATLTRREALVGRALFEVFPDNHSEHGVAELRASLERVRASRHADTVTIANDGIGNPYGEGGGFEERHWSVVNSPVLSESGEVLWIVHRIDEVTELVHATKALRCGEPQSEVLLRSRELEESNRRLHQMNEQLQAIYDQGFFAARIRLDGTVLDCSQALVDVCGFDRRDVIDRPFWDCGWWNCSADIQVWIRNAVMQAVSGVPFRGETRCFWADGSEHVVDFACMPIKDASGRVVVVVATGMDITDRVQVERAKPALEEHLRAVVETTPECVKLVARDGTLLQMNRSGLAMLDARCPDMVVGKNLYDLIAPEHRDGFRAFNERVCDGEKETFEFDIIGLSGTRRHMETHAAPLRMPDGAMVQLALTRDATQRRAAEEALREADRRKDEFIAILSHELRNPLAPLRSALQLLRLTGHSDDETARLHELMERQVNHLVRLVDDLLEASRISRGMVELRCERVELGSIVEHAVETSRPLIHQAGHQLDVELPRKPVWLDGDPVRLSQILSNLLNNAARFTPRGGRITIAAKEQGGEACVSVRDNGMGFAPEVANRLFEMFSKGASSRGLGVGLALARRLAEMHGGLIEGRSEGEGCGAEFLVRLPLPAIEAAVDAQHGRQAKTPLGCRVLVADDNRDAVEILAELIRAMGGTVALAYDGAEAVEVARAFQPDIALLDIGMPKMDGYQAAEAIRSESGARAPKLIALTGWGQEEDRRRAREAGFDEHVVKPVDLGLLSTLLASVTPREARNGSEAGRRRRGLAMSGRSLRRGSNPCSVGRRESNGGAEGRGVNAALRTLPVVSKSSARRRRRPLRGRHRRCDERRGASRRSHPVG